MTHTSVKLDTPIEFVNISKINPLISKCQIKVCYVSDKPNRNRSIITKEVAKEIAQSLPGSPIVGYYNESKEDYEEHNRVIEISNGTFDIKDTTFPYGFVDIGAKVWFQKFLDDGKNEHEYLMTEGYIWSDIYPESKRIIEKGNNQSMELSDKNLNAYWSKDKNGNPEFFIINEAIIEKLCILGEDCEPCFEGANITAPTINFSFRDDFNNQLFSMMKDLKDLLEKGGTKVNFTRYAVEIGDSLWQLVYSYLVEKYPDSKDSYCSVYRVEGIYEDNGQKFMIVQSRDDSKYYQINFTLSDAEGFVPVDEMVEVTKTYVPTAKPQFSLDDIAKYEQEYASKKKSEEEDKKDKENQDNSDNKTEDNPDEKSQDDGKDDKTDSEQTDDKQKDDEEKKKKKYSLDEVVEYGLLKEQFDALENRYNDLVSKHEQLEQQLEALTEFKKNVDHEKKQNMIDSFYMLSDDDKKDVIDNIDTYSLDDIEAKLSIICVRNKVNFSKDDAPITDPTTYSLDADKEDENVPAWVKAVREVAKTME